MDEPSGVTRAVVLGGGGPAGIAWEVGVVIGLADGDVDLREGGLFVGTSAGSVVAAQLAGGVDLEDLFARQVDPARQVAELTAPIDLLRLGADLAAAKAGAVDDGDRLRRVGAVALAARSVPEAARREVIAARLPVHAWPARALRVVAVDAATGARRVFSNDDGVDLVDAVAASCAVPGVWPTVTIGGVRYMDGGAYSMENADLAAGAARALILALPASVPPLSVVPLAVGLDALRASGAAVDIVHPDEATAAAFASVGGNLLDPSVRAPAALAGRAQGRRLAERVGAWWRGGR
jgi:NTE family protein